MPVERIVAARKKDAGGLGVRRLLPHMDLRAVGPFVFLDHMGPADFAPGTGLDVRPHPRIGLAERDRAAQRLGSIPGETDCVPLP